MILFLLGLTVGILFTALVVAWLLFRRLQWIYRKNEGKPLLVVINPSQKERYEPYQGVY